MRCLNTLLITGTPLQNNIKVTSLPLFYSGSNLVGTLESPPLPGATEVPHAGHLPGRLCGSEGRGTDRTAARGAPATPPAAPEEGCGEPPSQSRAHPSRQSLQQATQVLQVDDQAQFPETIGQRQLGRLQAQLFERDCGAEEGLQPSLPH